MSDSFSYDISVKAKVDIRFICDECNKQLLLKTQKVDDKDDNVSIFSVIPCRNCLEKRDNEIKQLKEVIRKNTDQKLFIV